VKIGDIDTQTHVSSYNYMHNIVYFVVNVL